IMASSASNDAGTSWVPPDLLNRISGAILVFNKSGGTQEVPASFDAEDAMIADLVASIASLADTRSSQEETLRMKDRRLHEVEAQLRHAEKLGRGGAGRSGRAGRPQPRRRDHRVRQ